MEDLYANMSDEEEEDSNPGLDSKNNENPFKD